MEPKYHIIKKKSNIWIDNTTKANTIVQSIKISDSSSNIKYEAWRIEKDYWGYKQYDKQ